MRARISHRPAMGVHLSRVVLAAVVLSFACSLLLTSDPGTAIAGEDRPRVLTVTAGQTPEGVRLRIEGSRILAYSLFTLAGPRRLIVDLPDTDVTGVDAGAMTGVEGLVGFRTIQYGGEADHLGRLEFTLSGKQTHISFREGNYGVEEALEVDGLEGNDTFFVMSTRDVVVDLVQSGNGAEALETQGYPEDTAESVTPKSQGSPGIEEEPSPMPLEEKEEETPRRHSPRPKVETYSSADISLINFEARGISNASAMGYGVMFMGGIRLGEIVSLEGALNWYPIEVIPLPLVWLPSEDGFYLNLAGGMRFNLVKYSSHNTVPWVSVWSTGHAVLGDFSTGGNGLTYGIGLDWEKKHGGRMQAAIRIHNFEGNLEIYEKYFSTDYGRTDIQAIELNLSISAK